MSGSCRAITCGKNGCRQRASHTQRLGCTLRAAMHPFVRPHRRHRRSLPLPPAAPTSPRGWLATPRASCQGRSQPRRPLPRRPRRRIRSRQGAALRSPAGMLGLRGGASRAHSRCYPPAPLGCRELSPSPGSVAPSPAEPWRHRPHSWPGVPPVPSHRVRRPPAARRRQRSYCARWIPSPPQPRRLPPPPRRLASYRHRHRRRRPRGWRQRSRCTWRRRGSASATAPSRQSARATRQAAQGPRSSSRHGHGLPT